MKASQVRRQVGSSTEGTEADTTGSSAPAQRLQLDDEDGSKAIPDITGAMIEGVGDYLMTQPEISADPSNTMNTAFCEQEAGEAQSIVEEVRTSMQNALKNTRHAAALRTNVTVTVLEQDGAVKVQLKGRLGSFYEKQLAQEIIRPELPQGWVIDNKTEVD